MYDIYGQTEKERNSIVELPEGFADNAGNTLYSWLGSLWRGLHRGDGMIRGLQKARGIRLAQLYLNILEAAKLQDRYGAPVFHRELWHPIVIRRSDRNKTEANLVDIGLDAEIGPQPEGSAFGEGTVLRVGRMADLADMVTYPVSEGIAGGAMTIVDNIVNPDIRLERDKDYWIVNDTIVFRKGNDPLSPESPYEKMDVPGKSYNPEDMDLEVVIWASDVLFDKNYIAEHISYALGANAPSSDVVKRILNAAWSSTTSGLTPELIKTLMAAMLNVPVIQRERETVMNITRENGRTVVWTDLGSYSVSPNARLRDYVYAGSTLKRGDLLDESLRIYPFLNVSGADTKTGFSVPLELDIPSVSLPSAILRARTEYGVYAMWWKSEVRQSETSPVDANGNPHLYFTVGGTDADVEAFWKDIWKKAEEEGVSMSDYLGEAGGEICPAEFFLKNLVGANTMFVVVDGSQAEDTSMMRDPMFFDMLSSVVPSAIRLFVVERRPVGGDDEDTARMDDAMEDETMAAALPRAVEKVSVQVLQGLEGRGPRFGEHVSMRLVRPSPRKVRTRKKEREEA